MSERKKVWLRCNPSSIRCNRRQKRSCITLAFHEVGWLAMMVVIAFFIVQTGFNATFISLLHRARK